MSTKQQLYQLLISRYDEKVVYERTTMKQMKHIIKEKKDDRYSRMERLQIIEVVKRNYIREKSLEEIKILFRQEIVYNPTKKHSLKNVFFNQTYFNECKCPFNKIKYPIGMQILDIQTKRRMSKLYYEIIKLRQLYVTFPNDVLNIIYPFLSKNSLMPPLY